MKNKNKDLAINKQQNPDLTENVDSDLTDSRKDQIEMDSGTFTIDLPDVKDIPGQEFIHPLPLGEIADTTISSDDEEGIGILDDEEDQSTE
jgi:hypothetical protein